ncbi:hypothetical protein QJS66_04510 [Kocuria rhizophila]|nr:hypothetical protein QJS66_04510 [Kocuria rhizophila]
MERCARRPGAPFLSIAYRDGPRDPLRRLRLRSGDPQCGGPRQEAGRQDAADHRSAVATRLVAAVDEELHEQRVLPDAETEDRARLTSTRGLDRERAVRHPPSGARRGAGMTVRRIMGSETSSGCSRASRTRTPRCSPRVVTGYASSVARRRSETARRAGAATRGRRQRSLGVGLRLRDPARGRPGASRWPRGRPPFAAHGRGTEAHRGQSRRRPSASPRSTPRTSTGAGWSSTP